MIAGDGTLVEGRLVVFDKDNKPIDPIGAPIKAGERFVRWAKMFPGGDIKRVIIISKCHPFWDSKQALTEAP